MRIVRAALFELAGAMRTKRALVLILLYLAASLLWMNGAISALGKMEDQLADVLQVERVPGKSGVVSAALWKSKPFQRIVRGAVGDSLVYDDLVGRHPVELLYAWIVFLAVPLALVAAYVWFWRIDAARQIRAARKARRAARRAERAAMHA